MLFVCEWYARFKRILLERPQSRPVSYAEILDVSSVIDSPIRRDS
jgi:hypothetical protein